MKATTLTLVAAAGSLMTASVQAALFTVASTGTVAATNNFPGAEAPSAAIDGNTGTKYLNFFELNTGYIFTPTVAGNVVTGINFVTGNDAEERDPASYILYGSNTAVASTTAGTIYNVDTNFTQISAGALALPAGRTTAGGNVTFTNTTGYNTFLLVFPTVKNSATANSMQIGEAVLQTAAGALSNSGVIGGGAIPEPSATALLGLGLTGLLTARRSR